MGHTSVKYTQKMSNLDNAGSVLSSLAYSNESGKVSDFDSLYFIF